LLNAFLYAGDLSCINLIYADLDAVSVTASHYIALHNGIDSDLAAYVDETAHAKIEKVGDEAVRFGDPYTFVVYRDYDPIVASTGTMRIAVRRSAIIGYLRPED
jgi:hypothetical protein